MNVLDRILGNLEKLVKSFTAKLDHAIVWEYSVSEVTETTFSGRKTSSDNPFADMVKIPLMPGIAGTLIVPQVGSLVGVIFLNGDPAKPRVVAWDQNVPTSVGLAGGGPAVHRVGDLGDGGSFSAGDGILTTLLWNGPEGSTWGILINASGSPCVATVVPVPGPSVPGKVVTKATTGSGRVTSG